MIPKPNKVDEEWLPHSGKNTSNGKPSSSHKIPTTALQTPVNSVDQKHVSILNLGAQLITPRVTQQQKSFNTNLPDKNIPKKQTRKRKASKEDFRANSPDSEPEEEFIAEELPRKRRLNTDGAYKDTATSEDSDEAPVFKPISKRRKHAGSVYATSSESQSDDEFVSKKQKQTPSPRSNIVKGPRAASISQQQQHLIAKTLKRKRHTPEQSPDSLEKYHSPAVPSAFERVIQVATPTLTPAPGTEVHSWVTKTTKKRRRASDRTFKNPAIAEDTDDDELFLDRRPKKNPKSKRKQGSYFIDGPSHRQLTPLSTVDVKQEPALSQSDRDALHTTTRKPSVYTKAHAERDAEDEFDDSDLQEPSAKRLKTAEVRFTNARLERLRQHKLETKSHLQSQMSEWLQGEIDLFEKLDMRALDPQLPSNWSLDFATLPLRMFASRDEQTSIRAFGDGETSNFRACKAFRDLALLGSYARDKTLLHDRPEILLERGINKYIRWSHIDAGLYYTEFSKRLVVVCDDSSDGPDPQMASRKLLTELQGLALDHRKEYIKANKLEPKCTKVEKSLLRFGSSGSQEPGSATSSRSSFNFLFSAKQTTAQIPNLQKAHRTSWWQRLFGWTQSSLSSPSGAPRDPQAEVTKANESLVGRGLQRAGNAGGSGSDIDANEDSEYELVEPELPEDMGTIYGILISHLIVQVVTYRVAEAEGDARSMIVADFAKDSMDIWNALALAITICHAREEILKDAKPLNKSCETDDIDA